VETLLDALWRHAAFVTPVNPAGAHLTPTPGPPVEFHRTACSTPSAAPTPAPGPVPAGTPTSIAVTGEGLRRYRQTQKYQGPRWWRTRADPFAEVWVVVQERLAADPTCTAKDLFREVQAEYPGRFPEGQLRTL
jgi:hypothetical protein